VTSSELGGVGVLVVRDGKVLMGRRTSPHGRGTWSPPGGKAEPDETPEETARRELVEETGLVGAVPRVVGETVDSFPNGDTWRTCWVQMEWVSGEPEVLEPDEVDSWGWYSWDRLPAPLFLPMASLVATGFDPG
jgi:8-oxo-dGTP diphosphatase